MSERTLRDQLIAALSVPDVHHPDHCDCGGCVCGVDADCHCDGDRCDGLEDQVAAVLPIIRQAQADTAEQIAQAIEHTISAWTEATP